MAVVLSDLRLELVETARQKRDFIRVPWKIYRGDPNWVPPLWADMRRILDERKNPLFQLGPHALWVAYRGKEPVGRLLVGIDEKLNREKKRAEGYLSLFESIPDYSVAEALFTAGLSWLKGRGMTVVTGPQSPDNGDDYRGLLIEGFDSPPVLMDSYNPPYYVDFFERYGFKKDFDRMAYYFDLRKPIPEEMIRGVEYAMKRYGFRVDPVDLRHLDREILAIKQVVDRAMPEEWPDMVPPTLEEIKAEARQLLPVAVPELIYIARSREGEPIGFSIALPDYNQVLRHLNGRLFPFGFLKFLWLRRRITGGRIFVLFVTPEYHKKGVSAAIYLRTFQAAQRLGYTYGEGSTIHEFNRAMNRDALGAGGRLYKKYRIYRKVL